MNLLIYDKSSYRENTITECIFSTAFIRIIKCVFEQYTIVATWWRMAPPHYVLNELRKT